MASISAALHDLLNEPDMPVEQALTRHFTDDYRQSTDGVWIGRAEFGQQMTALRGMVAHVRIDVIDELVHGPAYAERHRIHILGRDGTPAGQEVFVFAHIAEDGRFAALEELTRLLPADEADTAAR